MTHRLSFALLALVRPWWPNACRRQLLSPYLYRGNFSGLNFVLRVSELLMELQIAGLWEPHTGLTKQEQWSSKFSVTPLALLCLTLSGLLKCVINHHR